MSDVVDAKATGFCACEYSPEEEDGSRDVKTWLQAILPYSNASYVIPIGFIKYVSPKVAANEAHGPSTPIE